MTDSELKYYFPYYIENKYNFKDGLNNIERFYDTLIGKYKYFYENENNYGYKRDVSVFTEKEYCTNSYICSIFNCWLVWAKNGKNIFSFSKELLQMLEKTNVNDITYKSFNLPYDSFYISLRPLELKITSDCDKIIEGVFVSVERQSMEDIVDEDPNLPYDFAISFHFVGDFEELKQKYCDKIWEQDGSGGLIFWDYAFFFNEKENIVTIRDAINESKEVFRYVNFPENGEDVSDTDLEIFNYHIKFIENTHIILVNTLLYLSMDNKDKDIKMEYPIDLPFNFNKKLFFSKTARESAIIENKIKKTGFSKIQYVGHSLKNTNKNKSVHRNTISSHWRRGHWRNQLYGEGLINKRLIWIKPTIVNNQLGSPQKGHIYEIEE